MDQQKIDGFHRRASDHYMRGEYRQALEEWKRVLELDPSDEKAIEGVRLSSLLEGGIDHPLDGEAEGTTPGDGDLRRRLEEVDKRLETGDFHEALRAAEQLRRERPSDPDVLSALARASLAAGDSDQAAEVTSQLLSLDPAYAEAARLLEECRQLSPPQSPLGSVVLREAAEAPGSAVTRGVPQGPSPVPAFDSSSFLGDLIAPPEPAGRKPEAAPASAEETGLAPFPPASPATAPPGAEAADPATAVLRQRVQDLLGQAKQACASGRKDEALSLLSRLLILDEQNVEAMTLEEQLRQEVEENSRTAEERLAEGIRCLENDELETARGHFLQVLEAVPGHREAVGYLEKAEARIKRAAESAAAPKAPTRGKVWQGPVPEVQTTLPDQLDVIPLALPPDESGPEGRRPAVYVRPRRRWRTLAALGAGAAVLVVGGVLALRTFVGDHASPVKPAAQTAPARAKKPPAQAGTAPGAAAPVSALPALDRTRKIADAMTRGGAAFDAGKYDAAVLAYNEVLSLDPDNVEARKRLLESGALYRQNKAEIEKLERARKAFAQGEWDSALGTFYRLPAGLVAPAELNRYKVNGWYNLGLVSLRAANCAQATTQLGEAMSLDPSDAGVLRAKSLADACPQQQKDRSYYDLVGSLPFRSLTD